MRTLDAVTLMVIVSFLCLCFDFLNFLNLHVEREKKVCNYNEYCIQFLNQYTVMEIIFCIDGGS